MSDQGKKERDQRHAAGSESDHLLESAHHPVLCCPPQDSPDAAQWHPRVYLQISSQDGKAHCPYCGACYTL